GELKALPLPTLTQNQYVATRDGIAISFEDIAGDNLCGLGIVVITMSNFRPIKQHKRDMLPLFDKVLGAGLTGTKIPRRTGSVDEFKAIEEKPNQGVEYMQEEFLLALFKNKRKKNLFANTVRFPLIYLTDLCSKFSNQKTFKDCPHPDENKNAVK
ncbi:hypothetical protein Tco_1462372, partial [Tanacetum coccineum]